jgi:hypothetical protein
VCVYIAHKFTSVRQPPNSTPISGFGFYLEELALLNSRPPINRV